MKTEHITTISFLIIFRYSWFGHDSCRDQNNSKFYMCLVTVCRLTSPLGSGQFGEVYKGSWQCDGGEVEVAVKTMHQRAGRDDRVKFLQEAAIMGQFKHPNVVTMHGVVMNGGPVSGHLVGCR